MIHLAFSIALCFALGMIVKGDRRKYRTFTRLALVFTGLVFLVGCQAAWLSAVSAMLPSIETLVTSIIAFAAGLEGKTVSAATLAAISKIGADVKGQIGTAQTLIASYQTDNNPTTLGKISDIFTAAVASLGTILANLNITDLATTSKITQLVGLGVAAIQAVLGLIPLVHTTMAKYQSKQVSDDDVKHADTQAAAVVNLHNNQLKNSYRIIITTPSGNSDVDAVLHTVPAHL